MSLPQKEWNPRSINTITSGGIAFASPQSEIETGNAEWIFPENQLARILVRHFSSVLEVQSICINFGTDGYTVWTLLRTYDREAREKIYEQELKICQLLNIYDFDFRVTSIELVNPSELISTGSVEIFSRP